MERRSRAGSHGYSNVRFLSRSGGSTPAADNGAFNTVATNRIQLIEGHWPRFPRHDLKHPATALFVDVRGRRLSADQPTR